MPARIVIAVINTPFGLVADMKAQQSEDACQEEQDFLAQIVPTIKEKFGEMTKAHAGGLMLDGQGEILARGEAKPNEDKGETSIQA